MKNKSLKRVTTHWAYILWSAWPYMECRVFWLRIQRRLLLAVTYRPEPQRRFFAMHRQGIALLSLSRLWVASFKERDRIDADSWFYTLLLEIIDSCGRRASEASQETTLYSGRNHPHLLLIKRYYVDSTRVQKMSISLCLIFLGY